MEYAKPITRLIDALKKLPGVGPRSAQRLAWHIIDRPYEDAVELARAVVRVKKCITPCSSCFNFTEKDPCPICSDPDRDKGFICVVEAPEDVAALERAHGHPGVYHVLGGAIKPSAGIGPNKIRIAELVARTQSGGIREVLVATNPTLEGEATAMYIAQALAAAKVRVTRPAHGIPTGADIDFLDGDTLVRALRARQDFSPGKT